jgi:hypothetical protein
VVTGRVPAYHPPIFNDPFFTVAVMLGWLVMMAGAGILLLTAIRYARVLDGAHPTGRPPAFRALSALGATLFVGGLIWQLMGYFMTGVVRWTEDGRELSASVLGRDEKVDLALIWIEVRDLSVMPLGDSGCLEVGEPILAMGSPFGLEQTATAGIVSALDRKIELKPHDVMIQVDASINFGNSGGPVINRRGQAVGIATVAFTYEGGNTGIAFAIPTRFAEPTLRRLAAETGARP